MTAVQQHAALLLQGLTATRACKVEYKTLYAKHAKRSLLHPYQFCAHQGGLYCYAYLPSRQEVGVYSLESMQSVTLT